MASNYFSQYNKEFLFELPEKFQAMSNEEKYLKIADAAEKYGVGVEIPVIAYGISTNHSKEAVSERNAWVATEDEMINVPAHQIPEVEKMMQDNNAVRLCKQNHLAIVIIGYQNQWGDQFKVKWTDR